MSGSMFKKNITPSSSTLKTISYTSDLYYLKGCFMPVNFGTSGTISCNLTISATLGGVVNVIGSYASPDGSGIYPTYATVTINAGTRTGYTFNGWSVSSNNAITLANSNSATTTFSMPYPINMPYTTANITANWVLTSYSVAVNGSYANPTGAGSYNMGNTVYIYAGTRSGYIFSGWTVNSGGVSLANSSSATTSFTMPANGVGVTANWTPSGTPGWIVYGTSLLYPDGGGYEWRVPYDMYWGNSYYSGYAYFEYQWEADCFKYEMFNGLQYLDYYVSDTIYYQVYWEVEHFDNGYWSGGWGK